MVTKSMSLASDTSDTADSPDSPTTATRESAPAPKGSTRAAVIAQRPRSFREAFVLTAPKRAALQPSELVTPGPLDVTYAVSTALSAVVRLDQRYEQIAQRFPEELVEIDQLDTYTRAAAHAAMVVNTTLAPVPKLQPVYEAGLAARRLLVSDLSNAVTQSLISAEAPGRLSNAAGYTNVANDILAAVQFFTQGGDAVLDKIATSVDKLTAYEQLAYELIELSSRRVPNAVTAEEARDDLQRALTLLLGAYATAERVMAFFELRDQGYRKVVPSLYANKSKGRKETAEGEPQPAEPAEPITSGIEGVSPNAAVSEEPVAAGLRGGSPFVGRSTT